MARVRANWSLSEKANRNLERFCKENKTSKENGANQILEELFKKAAVPITNEDGGHTHTGLPEEQIGNEQEENTDPDYEVKEGDNEEMVTL